MVTWGTHTEHFARFSTITKLEDMSNNERRGARRTDRVREQSATVQWGEQIAVTATEAQNEFGRMLDAVSHDRIVVITRHDAPRAVLMSVARYDALTRAESAALDALTTEFDAMLARMQTPSAKTGVRRAFDASPEALGEAAVAKARPADRDTPNR